MAHRLAIKLDVFASTPLYQQLSAEIRRLIDDGLLGGGERLPSLRELSKQLQISVITVRQSIDLLLTEGYVVSRPGSGNYVSTEKGKRSRPPAESIDQPHFVIGSFSGICHDLGEEYTWSSEAHALTNAFNAFPFHPWWDVDVIHDFRAYQPSAEFLRGPRWDKSFGAASKELTQYPWTYVDPAGMPALREQIAGWLNRSRQLECNPDEIVIVSGAQQARELIARMFVCPSRTIVVEEPGSITDLLAYATKGGTLHHIDLEEDGIDTEALQSVTCASIIHLITAANFPTGITLSADKRSKVIKWAGETGSLIVEDAYGAGFHYDIEMPETIFSMAAQTGTPVVYIGSLSQFTSPALRIGFIVARKPLAELIRQAKEITDHHTSIVSQQMALTLFTGGFFDEHYLRLMKACKMRRQAMNAELSRWPAGLIRFEPVACGFQQAIWFDENVDDLYVFEQALKVQIGVIPMTPYFHNSKPRSGLSLNFARNDEQQMRVGLAKLLNVVQETVSRSAVESVPLTMGEA